MARWPIAALLLAFVASEPAQACRMYSPMVLEDVRYADVVVVGRIANYRIVRDEEFRRRMLSSPRLPADLRKHYEDPNKSLMTDYARFDIEVGEVLAGKAPRRLTATWHNSTFAIPPTMPGGTYVIALRDPASTAPPLRGPSATIAPNREPKRLTVLQAPCSGAFILDSGSDEARTVRRIVKGRRR